MCTKWVGKIFLVLVNQVPKLAVLWATADKLHESLAGVLKGDHGSVSVLCWFYPCKEISISNGRRTDFDAIHFKYHLVLVSWINEQNIGGRVLTGKNRRNRRKPVPVRFWIIKNTKLAPRWYAATGTETKISGQSKIKLRSSNLLRCVVWSLYQPSYSAFRISNHK
jgi:hypothetical protein